MSVCSIALGSERPDSCVKVIELGWLPLILVLFATGLSLTSQSWPTPQASRCGRKGESIPNMEAYMVSQILSCVRGKPDRS